MSISALLALGCAAFGVPTPTQVSYADQNTPVDLLASYYNAINRQEYQRAYGYWESPPRKDTLAARSRHVITTYDICACHRSETHAILPLGSARRCIDPPPEHCGISEARGVGLVWNDTPTCWPAQLKGGLVMCDTWVALRDMTTTQSVIFAKNSDRPIFDCQPLVFTPRTSWPAHATLSLEYVTLSQADVSFATLGSSPYWCWGYEEGINEYRVAIGNEAIYTKTFRAAAQAYQSGQRPALGLLGMDLVRLALERSRSAAQAIDVLGGLVERYGQFGSGVPTKDHADGGYDNAFLVADPSEAWVFEAFGQQWAARRLRQGCTSISNQVSIRTTWDAQSPELVQFAEHNAWWPETPAPFDVARAYIDERVPRQISHIRMQRSRQLLAEGAGQITPDWMMRIARDHYEGTFLDAPAFDAADPDFLSLCMHVSPADFTWGNTASSCVAVLAQVSSEPPVFWWTPGPPCNGCYVPFFVQGSQVPVIVSQAGMAGKQIIPPPQAAVDTFASTSYWWLFRQLMDSVKGDPIAARPGYYPHRNQIVRARFDHLEQEFAAEVPEIWCRYVEAGDAHILDRFTERCVERVVTALQGLLDELKV